MSSRDKKKQSSRDKGNDSVKSLSATSSPSEKVQKRNLDESPDALSISSGMQASSFVVPKRLLSSSNKFEMSSKQVLDLDLNASNVINPVSASFPCSTLEMPEKLIDSTPNLDSESVCDTPSSTLLLKVSASLDHQNLETGLSHENIASTSAIEKIESGGDMVPAVTSEVDSKRLSNIEHSQNEEVNPLLGNGAMTKTASVTLPLQRDEVAIAPANNDKIKNVNCATRISIESSATLQDSSITRGEYVEPEKDIFMKQNCDGYESTLEIKSTEDAESVSSLGTTTVHAWLNNSKECLYGAEAKSDTTATDDFKDKSEIRHEEIVSQDRTAKSSVGMPQSIGTSIFGYSHTVQSSRAYSNTNANNDGAKEKPKTRLQIAQNEKERYLKMSLVEKRQYYACEKDYVTLQEVETWPMFFTRSAARLSKKMPKNREIKRRWGENPNPNSVDIEIASKMSIWKGDITSLEIDCIVNAANSSLLGGGGVDGAIHRAAGSALVQECKTLNGCDTGDAKITGGYKLPAKYVIHTVGPTDGNGYKLTSCYRSCLGEMKAKGLHSIAFCCISTGIYGYPNEEAVHVALGAARKFLDDQKRKNKISDIERIVFCLFLPVDVDLYESWMQWYFPLHSAPDSTGADKNQTVYSTAADDAGEKHKKKEPDSPTTQPKEGDKMSSTVDQQGGVNKIVKTEDLSQNSPGEILAENKQEEDLPKEESKAILCECTDVQAGSTNVKCEVSISSISAADVDQLKDEQEMETEIDASKTKGHELIEDEVEESMETDSLVLTDKRSAPGSENCEVEKTHADISANL